MHKDWSLQCHFLVLKSGPPFLTVVERGSFSNLHIRHVNRLFYDPFILRRHFKENSRMTFQTETEQIFCDTCQI